MDYKKIIKIAVGIAVILIVFGIAGNGDFETEKEIEAQYELLEDLGYIERW